MTSKRTSLLDNGLAFLEDSQAELEAHDIDQADIDAMTSKYATEKAMQKRIDGWETTIKASGDPKGNVAKFLAIGKLALVRLQTSSNWKAQVIVLLKRLQISYIQQSVASFTL